MPNHCEACGQTLAPIATYRDGSEIVEALQWHDTDAIRVQMARWFDEHDAVFETRGHVVEIDPEVTFPLNVGRALPGDWIVWRSSLGAFTIVDLMHFAATYEPVDIDPRSGE